MPRTARVSAGNLLYHVLNRGNGRATVFRKGADCHACLLHPRGRPRKGKEPTEGELLF